MNRNALLKAIQGQPWAILPRALYGMLDAAVDGRTLAPATEAREGEVQPTGAVAVLPIRGTIRQRGGGGFFEEFFGGSSATTEGISRALRQQLADPNVKAIILDIDSPGGSVYGVDELASEIFKARGPKPIVAVANSLMASAAYYIGSQADEVWVTPGGEIGSIGVIALHLDFSGQAEMRGIVPTLVTAGKFKGEYSDLQPLTDEARAHLQEEVDRYYGMFVAAVARGRGAKVADVKSGMGEGRVVGAKDAIQMGMADKVGTLEEAIARAMSGRMGRMRAEDEGPPIEAQRDADLLEMDLSFLTKA